MMSRTLTLAQEMSFSQIDDDGVWREDAACRGVDPNLFWANDTAPAKAVCSECLVRKQCLDYALALGPSRRAGGVWGGKDEREIRRMRRRTLEERRSNAG